jgi:hypothetical protein
MLERKIAKLTAKLTEIVQDPISYNKEKLPEDTKVFSPKEISRKIWELEKNIESEKIKNGSQLLRMEKDLKNLYTELLKAVKNPEDYKSL